MITNVIMQSSNNLHLLLALSSAAQNLKRCVNVYRHHESERLRGSIGLTILFLFLFLFLLIELKSLLHLIHGALLYLHRHTHVALVCK